MTDFEEEISDIIIRKFHQLDGFESGLQLFHMLKVHYSSDLKNKRLDLWNWRCGKYSLQSLPKETDI